LRNTAENIKRLTPAGLKQEKDTKQDAVNALSQLSSNKGGMTGMAENSALGREADMQQRLLDNAKNLTAEEVKQAQIEMDRIRALDQRAIKTAEIADASEAELKNLIQQKK
jgi:hypothetical protein